MSDNPSPTPPAIPGFLDDYRSLLEAEMPVIPPGRTDPIGTITFAGPGHDLTIAQADRINRQSIQQDQEREITIARGGKWKPKVDTPDQIRERNITLIAERIVSFDLWTRDQQGNPQRIVYSPEMAKTIMLDRSYGWLFNAALEFLSATTSFIPTSATD